MTGLFRRSEDPRCCGAVKCLLLAQFWDIRAVEAAAAFEPAEPALGRPDLTEETEVVLPVPAHLGEAGLHPTPGGDTSTVQRRQEVQ